MLNPDASAILYDTFVISLTSETILLSGSELGRSAKLKNLCRFTTLQSALAKPILSLVRSKITSFPRMKLAPKTEYPLPLLYAPRQYLDGESAHAKR